MQKNKKTSNKAGKDKIEVNPKTTDSNGLQAAAITKSDGNEPQPTSEAVLNAAQRMKRASAMRRIAPKLRALRKIAAKRLATPERLKARSEIMARRIVKKIVAGQRGYDYANLSTGEKITIDKLAVGKHPLVKVIAKRIMPRIRQAELKRFAAMKAHPQAMNANSASPNATRNAAMGNGKVTEAAINELSNQVMWNYIKKAAKDVDSGKKIQKRIKGINKAGFKTHKNNYGESLIRKANETGISVSILEEVYNRGLRAHKNTNTSLTAEQYAFNRVNSFINGGAAFKMDSDLSEVLVLRKVKLPNGKIILKKVQTNNEKLVDEQLSSMQSVSEGKRTMKFRVAATYSDPKHPSESQRNEQVFRRYKVNTVSGDVAKKIMEKHLKAKGYKVHGIDVVEDVQESHSMNMLYLGMMMNAGRKKGRLRQRK